ncbi:geobacillin-26 family protein [Exiguobacterium sp. HVEsp1]|uniref:geobacillin-26 family protein n=1 Tax=Exiguobacterium sp. HVEsp1 TaxID=1934003 RepID=UPI000990F4F7|nr:geobacillin-26 family protein [Exiguobacterium sp. HVEsp1]
MSKRFIIPLTGILLTSTLSVGTGHAAENEQPVSMQEGTVPQTEIIEETDTKRVVRSLENEVETVATFDKLDNTVTVVVNGKEPVTIQLEAASSNQPVALARAATTGENTFSNYEYTITHSSPEKWNITMPKGDSVIQKNAKTVTYKSSTKSNLNQFKQSVDKINNLELLILGGASITVLLSGIALVLSLPTAGSGTLTTALAAAGVYGNVARQIIQLSTEMKNAKIYYMRA